MRLIDADALAKFIDYGHLNNPNEKLYSENDVREMIENAPTVDAVEVVRCKDCKHYREADPGHPDCDWCNRMICGTIRKGFFCADGERRSE